VRKPQVKRLNCQKTASDLNMPQSTGLSMQSGGLGNLMPGKSLKMMQVLGLTAGLTLSAWGHAVGLGGINVVSALGQPLKAEIELVAVSRADKPSLVARLASPDAYKGAGLDYPYGAKYTFQIESRDNGEPYLKLSSNREINDPFVSLLVELSWASGKLMREYTFLLDPPGYVAIQPKSVAAPEVVPAAVQEAPVEVKAATQTVVKPEEVKTEELKAVEVPAEPAARPAAEPAPAKPVKVELTAKEPIAVKRGDSLSKIAAQIKPDDVSLERMLVALYRANANQFDGRNMNRINVGKILRMPEPGALDGVSQAEAVQEIHAQSADWNAYRQKLAVAATSSRQGESTSQVATGKITAPVSDDAPVASETAKEVLRLSKGEKPGDGAGVAARSAQEKKNAAAEDAIARSKAAKEEKARVAMLEANLKDMQRLAKIKSEAAALAASAEAAKAEAARAELERAKLAKAEAAKAELAKAEAAKAELAKAELAKAELAKAEAAQAEAAKAAGAVASEVVAVSAVAPASEVVSPAASAVKPAVVAEPSLVDTILGSPMALALGAAVLLALGGLGVVFKRRKQAPVAKPKFVENSETTSSHLAVPVVLSPETGDFTAPAVAVEETVHHFDDVDPISEADLFLNFGRDEQAEEVLKDALERTPNNHQLHLKLLGIYANRQDKDAFAAIAQQLQDTGDVDAIQQAAVMGRKLDPANPLFGEDKLVVDPRVEDDSSATVQMLSFNDVLAQVNPVAESMKAPVHQVSEPVDEEVLDFDFDMPSMQPVSSGPAAIDFDIASDDALTPDVLDFDVASKEVSHGADEYHEPAREEHNLDDLIFDVMSSSPAESKREPLPSFEEDADEGFDDGGMKFTLDFPVDEVKHAVQPPVINLADINLELGDITEPEMVEINEAEVNGIGEPEGALEEGPAENSEQWHEVATKLDLARAYQEMGDDVGAREILDEVMLEGDKAQKQEAQLLLSQLN